MNNPFASSRLLQQLFFGFIIGYQANGVVIDGPARAMVENSCVSCHNPDKQKGDLDLQSILDVDMTEHPVVWEDVLWMIEEREMPPIDAEAVERPSEAEYLSAIVWLQANLADAPLTPIEPLGIHSLDQYCVSCHSGDEPQSGLDIAYLLNDDIHNHTASWEKIVRKLKSRQMPPLDRRRPDSAGYDLITAELEIQLDTVAAANPNPGTTSTFRRLTRYEYANAVRDLLKVEIDTRELLPRDEVSHGFDNITVTDLSPTLLDQYISAARKIAKLAMGEAVNQPMGRTVRIPADITQEKHIAGLPLGSRGGTLIDHYFPRDGEYEIVVRLARDRNEEVEGLYRDHQVDILLDRKRVTRFTVSRPSDHSEHASADEHLNVRIPVKAGQRKVGVTFQAESLSVLQTKREPTESRFNFHRHRRSNPAIFQVTINGPFEDAGPGNTASRKQILRGVNYRLETHRDQAELVLKRLARIAYHQPLKAGDLENLMALYDQGYTAGGFENGIEAGISGILVNPRFLFKMEIPPANIAPGDVYEISDHELATRMSFFLWSSLPDDHLLELAENGKLRDPDVLSDEVMRMLNDPKARSLTENFAGQWLYLRNLETVSPNQRIYPDFDDNLRQAMRRETELLFESIVQEDRNVMEFISADYTYLNERLAKHYEIPNIYGTRFRKIDVPEDKPRGGLLRHASILAVTSYANRTSPVIRGNWILENLIGAPPPPPPPDVPDLEDKVVDATLPIRERLTEHRADPSCAACHDIMDPLGFALENYDATGAWRTRMDGNTIDTSGYLADGSTFIGIEGLEAILLEKPDLFVSTLIEKLMIYGLGRGIEAYDHPAIRQIVRDAEQQDYSFSSLVTGIIASNPFQMRKAP